MTGEELLNELRKYRCSDLSDGMDALGLVDKGAMSETMRPLRPGISFRGFAYTVRFTARQEGVRVCDTVEEWMETLEEDLKNLYGWRKRMTLEENKNHVIVIDMGGTRAGIWGSDVAMKAMIMGAEGVVVDGGCRDSYEVNLEGAKVFCTRRTFSHAYGRVRHVEVNAPISCAGVTVKPEDVICADDDGVLVIPREKAEQVLMFARAQLEVDVKSRAASYDRLGMKHDDTLNMRSDCQTEER